MSVFLVNDGAATPLLRRRRGAPKGRGGGNTAGSQEVRPTTPAPPPWRRGVLVTFFNIIIHIRGPIIHIIHIRFPHGPLAAPINMK